MKIQFLAVVAAFSFVSPALAATTVNTTPADGFLYGTGNGYTPANAIVSTTESNELALRFHNGKFADAPASDANGVYSFALGTTPINFDFSIDGLATGASITLTNLLTKASVNYNPFNVFGFGNDNAQTCPACSALETDLTQNSARLDFAFLAGLGFNPNQNNTYQATLSAAGNSVTAFAKVGEGFTPAVPEPATWAMMLMGFGFMGVAMRRARRRSTTAVFA